MENRRLYRIYYLMKARCYNPSADNYQYYGAKGIAICEQWLNSMDSFVEWALSNGYRDDLTIDRIDPTGNYSPDNCRWISRTEQCNNRSSNVMITFRGKTQSLADLAREYHIPYHTFFSRLRANWDLERALTTPPHGNDSKKLLTWHGETKSINEWAAQLGVHHNTIRTRLYHGWSVDDALSIPPAQRHGDRQDSKMLT